MSQRDYLRINAALGLVGRLKSRGQRAAVIKVFFRRGGGDRNGFLLNQMERSSWFFLRIDFLKTSVDLYGVVRNQLRV